METSDSEHFESADEDFFSEEDTETSVVDKSVTSLEDKSVPSHVQPQHEETASEKNLDLKIKNITIGDNNKVADDKNSNESKPKEVVIQREIQISDSGGNKNTDSNLVKQLDNQADSRNVNVINESCSLNEKKLHGHSEKEETKIVEDINSNSCEKVKNSPMDEEISTYDAPKATKESEEKNNEQTEVSWNNDGWDLDEESDNDNLWTEDEIGWANEEQTKTNTKDSQSATRKLDKIDNTEESAKTDNMTSSDGNNDGWGSWGAWEVSSILSTATQSVSTLTSHVSQGLSTALEAGIGIPNPEELAKQHVFEKKSQEDDSKVADEKPEHSAFSSTLGFGFGNLVSGVSNITKFVETTGTKVISGGLDTLETIGKKTMEVLQEGDPGLKKKRSFLKLEPTKPVLSQVLRDAKLKAEQDERRTIQERHIPKKNYERIFDDHHGLVHLEALEMLSKQCEIKLQMLLENNNDPNTLTDIQETLEQVRELCEIPDEDDEEQLSFDDIKDKLKSAIADLNINISYDRLLSTWEETDAWLDDNAKLNICDENEIHQQGIEALAQLTAIAVEQYHKAGELLLIKDHRSTADEADSLVQLTTTLSSLMGIVAGKFTDRLNMKGAFLANKEEINSLITNVFFEAANSSSYIQDAFQLLIPVLQVGAVN